MQLQMTILIPAFRDPKDCPHVWIRYGMAVAVLLICFVFGGWFQAMKPINFN